MLRCKHCGCEEVIKDGVVYNKQRYKCKSCGRTFREGDERLKYSLEQKVRALKLYKEGMGLRSIERIEGISTPLLIQWIRNFGRILKEEISSTAIPGDAKDIEILEVDELFSCYQKKAKKCTYGLLLTETGMQLLILR